MEDYEKDALFGLTTKLLALLQQRTDDEQVLKQAQARLVSASDSIQKTCATFPLFGIDPGSKNFFPEISETLGSDRFNEAITRSGYKGPPSNGEGEVRTVGFLASLAEDEGEDDDPDANIKDLVLKRLKVAGNAGAKSRDIIDALREDGFKMHDKTVGMTLYRLSKEHPPLARREGHMWYPVEAAEGLTPLASMFE